MFENTSFVSWCLVMFFLSSFSPTSVFVLNSIWNKEIQDEDFWSQLRVLSERTRLSKEYFYETSSSY